MSDKIEAVVGKRVVLFPTVPADLENFVKLHRADKNWYMGAYSLNYMTEDEAIKYVYALLATARILAFTVITKEGKASRRGGYVYLSDVTGHSATLSGIMDKDFARGLVRQMKKGKHTYSQDAIHTALKFCFETLGLNRVEVNALAQNRMMTHLVKAENFKKEGTMREAFLTDDGAKDVVIYSLLKKEWEDVKDKET